MEILKNILGRKAEEVKQGVADGAAHVELVVILAEGRKLVNTLIDLSNEVESTKAAGLITDVAFAMQAIYDDLEKDPRDVEVAYNFLTYHAPRTIALVTTYAGALKDVKFSHEERAGTERTLQELITSFQTLLEKCKENDSEGLQFQSESLERLLKMQKQTAISNFPSTTHH